MYLKRIRIENTGPIDQLEKELQFQDDASPKPLVLVGTNGSGKSIVLAHIVSAMINAHGAVFDDSDMEKQKVYKLLSPSYITHGQFYALSCLEFTQDFFEDEITLHCHKKDFETQSNDSPDFKHWDKFPKNENSFVKSNFFERVPELESEFTGPHRYFPPNRFEKPAWLNEQNLRNTVEYFHHTHIKGISHRPVIQYSPMKDHQSWLLDLIYDSYALEQKPIAKKNETLRIN